ncbi:YqjF family protein [Saccharopolyspora sp. MS10]|uniref:YqjF family protein n=1 Tax=Saccharopolyspora sp. MS10 TaxID=3385973 RepID=UPI00399F00E5
MEPVSASTPRPVRRALLAQSWSELSFLHWQVDPELVAPLLPAGTRPDLFEGRAHAGLVPFRMRGVGPAPGLGVPYLGSFAETNVRLYSVDEAGRRGVVFRSLDAARLLPVLVARLALRLPYVWASMRVRRAGGVVRYTSRRLPFGPRSEIAVRPGERIAEPTPLEHFLTARWGMHVPWYGGTRYLPNEHPPWPLHRAELLECADELLAAAGLPVGDADPVSVLWSPGVPVRFGSTRPRAARGPRPW